MKLLYLKQINGNKEYCIDLDDKTKCGFMFTTINENRKEFGCFINESDYNGDNPIYKVNKLPNVDLIHFSIEYFSRID